jgi:hypothetical protein
LLFPPSFLKYESFHALACHARATCRAIWSSLWHRNTEYAIIFKELRFWRVCNEKLQKKSRLLALPRLFFHINSDERIFMKFDSSKFYETLEPVSSFRAAVTGTLHGDCAYTCLSWKLAVTLVVGGGLTASVATLSRFQL